MATVAPSNNYTDESRRFQQALLDGEPGTENGGLYADKAGYHNKRENLPMPDATRDYSIEAPADQRGPDDKSAAHDWSFPEAWGPGGDHRRIGRYMARIRDAFNRRDPRLKGWREVLGCLDANPDRLIGYDFDKWTTRTPDPTHWGHLHLSEHREFVGDWGNKVAMLEVLGLAPDRSNAMLCTFGDIDPADDPREGRVGALQARLWFLGYDVGSPGNPTDGHYGPKTRDALKAACATVGWETSGEAFWAGEWAALEKAVVLHWAAPAAHEHAGDGDGAPAAHRHDYTSSVGPFEITGTTGPAEPV